MTDIETLDTLPGEGDVEVVTLRREKRRRECEVCGEPAHFKHTYLLDNARRNPASSAYQHDDCSWCEDERRFVCREHKVSGKYPAPDGHGACSTFPATAMFAHLFLYVESKPAPPSAPRA